MIRIRLGAWLLPFALLATAAQALARTNYVALDGGHVWPYTNWYTAATNVQDAVDAAGDGDWVLVSSGTYARGGAVLPGMVLRNRVCITNSITLASVHGARATVIEGAADPLTGGLGSNAVRCVSMTNHATLIGFTLSNGHTAVYEESPYYDGRDAGFAARGNCTVGHCRVVCCDASIVGGGGGVYKSAVISCELLGNTASKGGGGLTAVGSTINATTAIFNHSSEWGGGGIQTSGIGSTQRSHVLSCVIVSNIGRVAAGLNCWGDTVVSNCRVAHNRCIGDSIGVGGIRLDRPNVVVVGSQVDSNHGPLAGGVRMDGNSSLENSVVEHNSAASTAGGVWLPYGDRDMFVRNCIISSNACSGSGGAVFNQGTVLFTSNVISGNTAVENGGGIDSWYAGTFSNCVIMGNRAAGGASTGGQGGGVSMHSGGQLTHCIISDNHTHPAYDGSQSARGGGVSVVGAGEVNNCLIVGNGAHDRSSYGGGVSSPDDSAVIQNCTIAGNYARDDAGGVDGGTIRNSIVYHNSCDIAPQPNYSGGSFAYSCTYPLPSGDGNISNAPLTGVAYHLLPGSPCINAGTNAYVSWETDLAGAPRIINGIVDMGAYEAVPEACSLAFIFMLVLSVWRTYR